jgi:hypothetical protein
MGMEKQSLKKDQNLHLSDLQRLNQLQKSSKKKEFQGGGR